MPLEASNRAKKARLLSEGDKAKSRQDLAPKRPPANSTYSMAVWSGFVKYFAPMLAARATFFSSRVSFGAVPGNLCGALGGLRGDSLVRTHALLGNAEPLDGRCPAGFRVGRYDAAAETNVTRGDI